MVRAAVVAFCVCLAVPCHAGPKGDYKKYLEERDDSHASAFKAEFDQANQAVVKFRDSMADQKEWEVVGPLFESAMNEAHQASEARGRGLLLSRFRTHFLGNPSILESELWLQTEAEALSRDYETELPLLYSEYESAAEKNDSMAIVAATQAWIEAHGEIKGRSSELATLTQSFYLYARRKGERDLKRASALRSFFGGMAAALAVQPRTSPPERITPWMVHCQEYFSGTQCNVQ